MTPIAARSKMRRGLEFLTSTPVGLPSGPTVTNKVTTPSVPLRRASRGNDCINAATQAGRFLIEPNPRGPTGRGGAGGAGTYTACGGGGVGEAKITGAFEVTVGATSGGGI